MIAERGRMWRRRSLTPAPAHALRMSRFRVCRPTFHAPMVGDMNRRNTFAAIDFSSSGEPSCH